MTMKQGTWLLAFGLLGVLIALPACQADEKKEVPADDGKGWVSLFNGKDLSGWKIHDKPSNNIVEVIKIEKDGKVVGYDGKLKDGKTEHLWRVEGGLLIGSGNASHLFSERDDYENFRYRIEAKVADKGNSGQYFRTAYGPGFPKGYEAQINATHGDKIKTGSLYPAGSDMRNIGIQVMDTAPHKADEFFVQEVIANGNHIQIFVNGKQTVDWKDPQHRFKKGHFALQGHDPGTVVTFKKIEVKEIK